MVYKLHPHPIFVTKYQKKVMTDRVADELRSAFEEVCGPHDVTLDAFETNHDHAHLLVSYPPKVALSTPAMTLKAASSIRVLARHPPEVRNALCGDHFWSPSYCVLSCGGAPQARPKSKA